MSAGQLAFEYALAPAKVHAAFVYEYDHTDEIDRAVVDEARDHAARAMADTSPLAERMRRAARQAMRKRVSSN